MQYLPDFVLALLLMFFVHVQKGKVAFTFIWRKSASHPGAGWECLIATRYG